MDVKKAVRVAREYLTDLMSEENISDVGLEEVFLDIEPDTWKITIGFSRPWDRTGSLAERLSQQVPRRSYKVVTIHNMTGQVVSITDRLMTPSG